MRWLERKAEAVAGASNHLPTSNIEHRTLNIEHLTTRNQESESAFHEPTCHPQRRIITLADPQTARLMNTQPHILALAFLMIGLTSCVQPVGSDDSRVFGSSAYESSPYATGTDDGYYYPQRRTSFGGYFGSSYGYYDRHHGGYPHYHSGHDHDRHDDHQNKSNGGSSSNSGSGSHHKSSGSSSSGSSTGHSRSSSSQSNDSTRSSRGSGGSSGSSSNSNSDDHRQSRGRN